jgi:hypothetical protein
MARADTAAADAVDFAVRGKVNAVKNGGRCEHGRVSRSNSHGGEGQTDAPPTLFVKILVEIRWVIVRSGWEDETSCGEELQRQNEQQNEADSATDRNSN